MTNFTQIKDCVNEESGFPVENQGGKKREKLTLKRLAPPPDPNPAPSTAGAIRSFKVEQPGRPTRRLVIHRGFLGGIIEDIDNPLTKTVVMFRNEHSRGVPVVAPLAEIEAWWRAGFSKERLDRNGGGK